MIMQSVSQVRSVDVCEKSTAVHGLYGIGSYAIWLFGGTRMKEGKAFKSIEHMSRAKLIKASQSFRCHRELVLCFARWRCVFPPEDMPCGLFARRRLIPLDDLGSLGIRIVQKDFADAFVVADDHFQQANESASSGSFESFQRRLQVEPDLNGTSWTIQWL